MVYWFLNANSYLSFKERRLYNPCETNYFTKCSFHLVSLGFGSVWKCHPKNEKQKWTDIENWISSYLVALLQGKIMFNWTNNHLRFNISLLNQPLRSLNEFAEDAHGLVVFTHGLAVVALKSISTEKSAISYLQTCNINFFSLVYSLTYKGKTGKSYTSVLHGLHTSRLLLCPTEIWFVHMCR